MYERKEILSLMVLISLALIGIGEIRGNEKQVPNTSQYLPPRVWIYPNVCSGHMLYMVALLGLGEIRGNEKQEPISSSTCPL